MQLADCLAQLLHSSGRQPSLPSIASSGILLKSSNACRFLLYNLLTLMYFTVSACKTACCAGVTSLLVHVMVSKRDCYTHAGIRCSLL